MSATLEGLVVLEVGTGLSAAYTAAMLADLGATVVKLEDPRGDRLRMSPPLLEGVGALFAAANRNKHMLCFDGAAPGAGAALDRIVGQVDVIIDDCWANDVKLPGVRPPLCHERKPSLVHCTIQGAYPDEPPRPDYNLLIEAESGFLSLYPRETPPGRGGVNSIDLGQLTALWATQAVLAALLGPRDHAVVSVSALDAAVWLLSRKVTSYLATGEVAHQPPAPPQVYSGVYATRSWDLAVVLDSDRTYRAFAEVLGRRLADDETFASGSARLAGREELDRIIRAMLAHRDADTLYRKLRTAGVPVAIVQDLPGAIRRHASASSRGLLCLHESGPAVVAPPITVSGSRWRMRHLPGPVGADTRQALELLDFEEAEMAELARLGVVGAEPVDRTTHNG